MTDDEITKVVMELADELAIAQVAVRRAVEERDALENVIAALRKLLMAHDG